MAMAQDAGHHPRADAPLMAFHELMEPLWHAIPGPDTNARACRTAGEIVVRARAAAVRPTPDHGALIVAAEALTTACAGGEAARIGSELDRLHRLFHKLAGGMT